MRHFSSEGELEKYIRDNTTTVFGEEIEWKDEWRTFYSEFGTPMPVDLVGQNANGELVIAEVKVIRNDDTRHDRAREAIGQMLHYLYASMYKMVNEKDKDQNPFREQIPTESELKRLLGQHRLYIVSAYHSPAVENICRFLGVHGINIEYISLNPSL